MDYSVRLAEHQEKLTTRFNEIVEILYEADAWAAFENSPYVTAEHADRAVKENSPLQ